MRCDIEHKLLVMSAIRGRCPDLATCNRSSCRLISISIAFEKTAYLTIETEEDIKQNQALDELEAKRRDEAQNRGQVN